MESMVGTSCMFLLMISAPKLMTVCLSDEVPSDILDLFNLRPLTSPHSGAPRLNANFYALLGTLSEFVSDPSGPGTLPLSASLPDMKTDTESYVRLQNLYRDWAKVEKVFYGTCTVFPYICLNPAILGSFQGSTCCFIPVRG